jgi:hypothetical protein
MRLDEELEVKAQWIRHICSSLCFISGTTGRNFDESLYSETYAKSCRRSKSNGDALYLNSGGDWFESLPGH